jgi:glycosyltransferase involved in cell wall biosynthesis
VPIFNKFLKKRYCLTNHNGGLSGFYHGNYTDKTVFFADSLRAPGNIVLSQEIKSLFLQYDYKGFLRVLWNGVETQQFTFKYKGNGKAVNVGKILTRKRQAVLAAMAKERVNIDFIGPKGYDPEFIEGSLPFEENKTCTYLGAWNRETLYESLTNYSCLVLYSNSEAAAPLVVLEALAAGLSIVVTKSCSANLEKKPFIHIIPDNGDESFVIATIQKAILENEKYRKEIKQYAFERFDYSVVVKEYIQVIEEFRSFYSL